MRPFGRCGLPMLALSLCAIALAGCRNQPATLQPELLPTRTSAPASSPRAEAASTSTPAAGAQPTMSAPGAAPSPDRAPTSPTPQSNVITADSAANVKLLLLQNQTPPSHLFSATSDRVVGLTGSEHFDVLDAQSLRVLTRTTFAPPPGGDAYWYAISPNGKRAATMFDDGVVNVYDLDAARPVTQLMFGEVLTRAVADIALSHDGAEIVVANGDVQRYDIASGKKVGARQVLPSVTRGIYFSENGEKLVARVASSEFNVLDTVQAKSALTFTSPFTQFSELLFSPDGSLLGISDGANSLSVWNVSGATAKRDRVIVLPDGGGQPVFDGSGRTMAVLADTEVGLFDMTRNGFVNAVRLASQARVYSAHFDPSGKELFVSGPSGVERVNVSDGARLAEAPAYATTRVVLSGDGRLAATFHGLIDAAEVSLVDASTGKLIRKLYPATPPRFVHFSSSGAHVFAAGRGPIIQAWRVSDGVEVARVDGASPGASGQITPLCVTNDDRELLTLEGDSLVTRSLTTRSAKRQMPLSFTPEFIGGCSPVTNSVLLADKAKVYNVGASGTLIAEMPVPGVGLVGEDVLVSLSRDGRFALAQVGNDIYVWNARTGALVRQDKLNQPSRFTQLSASGRYVLSNFDERGNAGVELLDVTNGARKILPLPSPTVFRAFMTPDESAVITVRADGRDFAELLAGRRAPGAKSEVTFWNVATGRPIQNVSFDGIVFGSDVSDDATTVVAGTVENSFAVFGLPK